MSGLGVGPKEISYPNLTLFEVRVLGAFIGSFSDMAIALGVEADVLMDIFIEEMFESEQGSSNEASERMFHATWSHAGETYDLYAAWTSEGWTEAFPSEEDLMNSLPSGAFRI